MTSVSTVQLQSSPGCKDQAHNLHRRRLGERGCLAPPPAGVDTEAGRVVFGTAAGPGGVWHRRRAGGGLAPPSTRVLASREFSANT